MSSVYNAGPVPKKSLPTHFFKRPGTDKSGPIGNRSVFVTHLGGAVQLNGLELATRVNILLETEFFRQGEDVILFLAKDESEPGTFLLEGGPFGAFRVKGGMVAYMTHAVRENHPDEPLTALEQRVSEALAMFRVALTLAGFDVREAGDGPPDDAARGG